MSKDEQAARLRGKVALITGAGSGIGEATARVFAAHGAALVLADVTPDGVEPLADELAAGGAPVRTHVGDVSHDAEARAMVAAAVEAFGGLDVLVASAGVFLDARVEDVTEAGLDHVLAVDAKGTFLTCQHAIAAMRTRGRGGAIVCLSSISGLAGQERQSAYGAAKFAVSGLTMHLAVECAREGIRVNAVAPGTIATAGLSFVPEDKQRAMRAAHPMGRFGEPEEVARAILFLASDDASFVSGVVLPVDGAYMAR
jgi:NAD(P)-dependent dehydrogenase (short-subunit alcohol dehydrogenase family)